MFKARTFDLALIALFYFSTFGFAQAVGAATTSPYSPKCFVGATMSAPNQPITFIPSPPPLSGSFTYKWIGEASTTSFGTTTLSFIYPGAYTVVLEAKSSSNVSYQVPCPSVVVSFDATSTVFGNTGAFYPFPFASSSAKILIPKESIPLPSGCLNLVQNLSYGYYDDVKNPKDGVIYKLQQFLKARGYLKVNPTGYFGNLTRLAVKEFQWENGIESTGFVGPLTRAKIKSISCKL